MENNQRRLLSARGAATYLGISLSTLHRIEKQGLLVPFRTPGGHRRYDLQMLNEYLEITRQNHHAQWKNRSKLKGEFHIEAE